MTNPPETAAAGSAVDIDSVHHVGLLVAGMDEGSALYKRLGFHLTPLSHHERALKEGEPPKPIGTANRTATFQHTFVEILAHVCPDIPDVYVGRYLQRFPGLHICTFNTPDADAVAARLEATGQKYSGPGLIQRDVATPHGPKTLRARTVHFGDGFFAEGGLGVAQSLTPELALQTAYQEHPNGALDIVDSVLCVADDELDGIAARYERHLGRKSRSDGGVRVIDLELGRLTLVPDSKLDGLLPGEAAPALPAFIGYEVAVRNLDSTRALLERNGFPVRSAGERIFVPARSALGGAVIFSQTT